MSAYNILHLLPPSPTGGGPEPDRRHVPLVPGARRSQRGAQVEAHAPLCGPVLVLSATGLHGARLTGGGTYGDGECTPRW